MNRFPTENYHHLALDISAIDAENLFREKKADEGHHGDNEQQRKRELAP